MPRVLAGVREFLAMGVLAVWVLDPARRVVEVYAGQEKAEYQDGVVGVPGTPIVISIREIFSVLD